MISSPFLIARCSLLTRSRFVQPSFCRDPFPIGTKEWKYPVDWLGPGSWVMTECPPDYLWDLCSSSQDPLRSLDTSPRLRDCYWQFLPPQDEWFDLSDEDLVMTMIDLNFSPVLVLSRVCQISFGNLSHPDQHQLSHETQIFMSDDWSLRLTCGMNENHEVFSSRMCFNSPGLKIAQLRPDSGSFVSWSGQLYNSIAPLRSPGSLDVSQTKSSFPPPLSLMLRHITISPSREKGHLHCYFAHDVREEILWI